MSDVQLGAGAVLSLQGLQRRYRSGEGELTVLDGADVLVDRGQLVAVVGRVVAMSHHCTGILNR